MGKIWLRTSGGSNIHLPIVGVDLNTPETAILVSAVTLETQNRCLSGQIAVVVPTYGTVTFDFGAPNRTGTCNQCGQCCSHPIVDCPHPPNACGYIPVTSDKANYHACQYLTILPGGQRGIGKIGGTECSLRATIIDRFKGCTLFPNRPGDKASYMTICGFTFSG